MSEMVERREARRFNLNLPLLLRFPGEQGASESKANTRNISFRGLYFVANSVQGADSRIEFILTLPDGEIPRQGSEFRHRAQTPAERFKLTGAGDLRIRGFGRIVRTEPQGGQVGVALRIERYEFLAGTE